MFNDPSAMVFGNASVLRHDMTNAEVVLWSFLRKKPLGFKFRRQHPWGSYIADFYCHRLKLVIEIDGSIHNQPEVKEHDEERQEQMEFEGLTVMRFTNADLLTHPGIVFEKIEHLLRQNMFNNETTSPLGAGGRGLRGV